MSARLAGVIALSTLAVTTLDAQTAEQRSVKGATVAVYNLVGRMRAIAGTGAAVGVEITRGGRDASRLRVETGTIGGRETLRIVYPSDRIVYPSLTRSRTSMNVRPDGTFGDWTNDEWRSRSRGDDRVEIRGYGDGLEAFADLVVRIPKGQRIELFLGVGRLDVANVEGNIMVDVSAADVDVSGTTGTLSLDTGSGRVAVRDVTGDLYIDTGSGGLTVDRAKGTILNLDSGSGGVHSSDMEFREIRADVGSGGLRMYRVKASDVQAETGSGGIVLELLSDVQRLDVETGSGGATIRAPATLSAEVEAETGSGGFSTDFEITTRRMGRNHIQGRIGEGKGRIRIEAGSGSVRLLKN